MIAQGTCSLLTRQAGLRTLSGPISGPEKGSKNGDPKRAENWRHEVPSEKYRSAPGVASFRLILGTRFWDPKSRELHAF